MKVINNNNSNNNNNNNKIRCLFIFLISVYSKNDIKASPKQVQAFIYLVIYGLLFYNSAVNFIDEYLY